MDKSPLDKEVAALLFQGNKPDPAGAVGQELPLATSATVFIDAAGHITMRLATGGSGPVESFVLAPYTAVRLACALAEVVNLTGQYGVGMTVDDADQGRVNTLTAPSTGKN